jgi:hypothetical protein
MADAAVREALDKLAGATDAARIALRQARRRAGRGSGFRGLNRLRLSLRGRGPARLEMHSASASPARRRPTHLSANQSPNNHSYPLNPHPNHPNHPILDPQAELPELLEALDGASPASALPEGLARELADVAGIGGVAHLRGVRARGGCWSGGWAVGGCVGGRVGAAHLRGVRPGHWTVVTSRVRQGCGRGT